MDNARRAAASASGFSMQSGLTLMFHTPPFIDSTMTACRLSCKTTRLELHQSLVREERCMVQSSVARSKLVERLEASYEHAISPAAVVSSCSMSSGGCSADADFAGGADAGLRAETVPTRVDTGMAG
jgi:hypothetical protein